MTNLNSKNAFFEGKKFDNTTHHSMPKVKFNSNPKKRRRTNYKGIVNQDPVKPKLI